MPYTGLKVDDTVHDTSKSSHAIPAYPEFNSTTVFDDNFYRERRDECDRLMGASIDYHEEGAEGNVPAVDVSDATVGGPSGLGADKEHVYTLSGDNDEHYVRDYHVVWSVPVDERSIWKYTGDTTDILVTKATGLQSGAATITCTLTDRKDSNNVNVFTLSVTSYV